MTVIGDYRPWAARLARELLGNNLRSEWAMDWEDLMQIGMIALWEAEQSYDPSKGSLPYWLTFKARGVMKDAIRQRQKHEAYKHTESDDLLVEYTSDCRSVVDQVIEAYHAGEISTALESLTERQREYVRMRFWEGKNTSELTAHFGYDPRGVWKGVKQKLTPKLEHLVTNS